MKILLSNDDGILAPGLAALREVAEKFGETFTVAPESNMSGISKALSLEKPLSVQQIHQNAWSVNGTPTDCVYLAQNGDFAPKCDMLITGINTGANIGDDVLYSGTVAAAVEGRFGNYSYPIIAISLCGWKNIDTAAKVLELVLPHIKPSENQILFNINVPDTKFDDLQGIEVTQLQYRNRQLPPVVITDPRGRKKYWIAAASNSFDELIEHSDINAIANKRVSITPLNIDYTDYDSLEFAQEFLLASKLSEQIG